MNGQRFEDVATVAYAAFERVLEAVDKDDAQTLIAQAHRGVVTRHIAGRMIDLEIPRDVQRCAFSDGPLPMRAMVIGKGNELTGEFLIWVKGGWLVGIEQAWFTDVPPTRWPMVDELVFPQ